MRFLPVPVLHCVAAAFCGVSAFPAPSPVSGQPILPDTVRSVARSFLITETTVSSIAFETGLSSDRGNLTLELGYAWDRGERSALGGTVFLKGGDLISGVGVRPRYRHWLDRNLALDVSPGVRFSSNGSNFKTDFSGQLALSYHEIGIVLEADTADEEIFSSNRVVREESRLYWSLGGRLGGWPGVVVAAGILILALSYAGST